MSSRLAHLSLGSQDTDQEAFCHEPEDVIGSSFGDIFETKTSDGSFIGPFGVLNHHPTIGRPFFALMLALAKLPGLSITSRQTVILTVAGHFESSYPKYAHSRLTLKRTEMSEQGVSAILEGRTLDALDPSSKVAQSVTKQLLEKPGPLDEEIWRHAVQVLGMDGTSAVVHFVGFYAYTCLMLNGFDSRPPVDEK